METLVRGVDDLRLGGGAVSVSDLLDAEPGADALPLLLDSTQGLGCGPSQNGLSVQRGLQSLTAGDPLEALHYLAECHSTTLRQYMIMKSSCRLAQLQVKAGRRVDGWPDGTQEALLDARRRLLQYKPSPHRRQEMLEIIRQVPPDWTVIQLTAVPRARCRLSRHDTPQLVLSRFTGGAPDSLLLTRVPAPTADHCCTFRSEFEAMLADNGSIQRSLSNDRQKYWAERGLLDDRMKAIVRSMEVAWLGRHAYLASGAIICPEQRRAVEETLSALPTPLTVEQRARLGLLCARLPDSPAELSTAVSAALGPTTVDQRRAVTEALAARRSALGAAAAGARRGQVILVLDRDVQRYPWETVGALALGPACRLPSLALLGLCLAGRRGGPERPPAAGGATYILNPAGDLANTEQRMGPFLEERGWSGIVGRPPTLKEFAAALTDGLILAYCGHGSGSQYLPAEKLRSLTCNAVALLFGCSSGQLVQPGPTADPHGSVHAYLMANCPAILGNLWSVTDNMLDTYSKAVIEEWTDGVGSRSLPEAVSAARGSVSSTFMAAAPVVYGLPVTPDGLARSQTQQDAPVVYGLPVTHDGLARSQTQQDGPDRTQLKTQGRTQPDWILSDRTNRTPPDAQDSTQSRGAERAELEGPDSAAQSDRLSGPGRTQRDSALGSCSDPGRAQLDKPSGPGRTKRDGSSSRVRTSKLTRQTDQQPDKLTSAPERARSAKAAGRTQRASRRI